MRANGTISRAGESDAACMAAIALNACLSLAMFMLTLAAACATARNWDLSSTMNMTVAAAAAALWSLWHLHRRLTEHPSPAATREILGRQLICFAWACRVPLGVWIAGCWAITAGKEPSLYWAISVPLAIWGLGLGWRLLRWLLWGTWPRNEHLRGTRLLNSDELRGGEAALQRRQDEVLDWCGVRLPMRFARGHFAIIGATDSGKTVAMRLLMQSILPSIVPGSRRRAMVYDAKQDCLEILSGMKLRVPVLLLNPFDTRSTAWEMAADITTPATALQVSQILIPEEQSGQNAFFTNAARDLLAATFTACHLTNQGKWTLADVVLTLSSTRRASALLRSLPQTRHVAQEYFDRDPRTLANVQSTISAHMAMLRPIAAMWNRTTSKISLRQWSDGESILVLGNDETLRGPLDAVNRVLFQRATELILAQSEDSTRQSWFFLDELKEMGKLDGLPRLMTKGRSKGARVVMAWQTIEGLRSVYTEKLADEVAGMAGNKAFLRTDSQVTAQWASKVLGEYELREWTGSVQHGASSTTSRTEHIVKREAVLPSQIMQLPLADRHQFTGYFICPAIGLYRHTVEFGQRLWPLGEATNFVPRPDEEQYLTGAGLGGFHPFDAEEPVCPAGQEDLDEGRLNVDPPFRT